MMENGLKHTAGLAARLISGLAVSELVIHTVNHISAWPFIRTYRAYTHLYREKGNAGPYKQQIGSIKGNRTVTVTTPGNPDAKIWFYAPKERSQLLPVVIYIHGGGWCTGRATVVEPFVKTLASQGYLVANVDYALAPEYPWPVPVRQLCGALEYVQSHAEEFGGDSSKVFIAGNSAGAHLAACIGAILTDRGLAQKLVPQLRLTEHGICGLLLFNGVYNMKTAGSCGYPYFDLLAWGLTGRRDYENDPRITELSPVNFVAEDFPPTYITVGDSDPLESQTIEMLKALEDHNAVHTALLWCDTGAGLPHDYIFNLYRDEARQSLELMLEFMKKQLEHRF